MAGMSLSAVVCRKWRLLLSISVIIIILHLYWQYRDPEIRATHSPSVFPKIRITSSGPSTDAAARIPRIIHQTWKSASVPQIFEQWIRSWLKHNPHFEYWFWDDEDIRQLVAVNYPTYLMLFDSYPTGGYRADAFRYFVLYEHGGIYADLDMECLKPLGPVVEARHGCIIAEEPPEHAHFLSSMKSLVSNGFMACRREHPFFRRVIQRLPLYTGRFSWNDILHATGPYMLTDEYESSKGSAAGPKLAFPTDFMPTIDESMVQPMRDRCMDKKSRPRSYLPWNSAFYAREESMCSRLFDINFSNTPIPESFTDHHWTHTWADAAHDPWGVKNWRIFFDVNDLRTKQN